MNNNVMKYAVILLLLLILIIIIALPILLCVPYAMRNTSIPVRDLSGSGEGGYGGAGGVIGKDCAKILIQEASGGKVSDADAQKYIDYVNAAASKYGQDPAFMLAQINAESHFNPRPSTAGAQGIAQFMPGTFKEMAQKYDIDGNGDGKEDILEPADSIYAQAAYNKQIKEQLGSLGTIENIAAAYNAGPSAVQKYGGIPNYPETQKYVRIIMGFYPKYKKCLESTSSISNLGGNFYPLGKGYPLQDPFSGGTKFGADRGNGRLHAGVDLVANVGANVYAIKDGTIVSYYKFTDPGMGLHTTYAIFVDHGDYVANYGEVSNMASGLKVGSKVKAGQNIGNVGKVSEDAMLHFELYKPGTTTNQSWIKADGQPKNLLDPTSLLQSLQNNRVE